MHEEVRAGATQGGRNNVTNSTQARSHATASDTRAEDRAPFDRMAAQAQQAQVQPQPGADRPNARLQHPSESTAGRKLTTVPSDSGTGTRNRSSSTSHGARPRLLQLPGARLYGPALQRSRDAGLKCVPEADFESSNALQSADQDPTPRRNGRAISSSSNDVLSGSFGRLIDVPGIAQKREWPPRELNEPAAATQELDSGAE